MLEKSLHTGNLAAAFSTLATTAADLTVCGGATTIIGGALSGLALFKTDRAAKSLAEQMGKAFEAAIKGSPLADDGKKLIPQIMHKYPVTEDMIAQGNMKPALVAAIVRKRIEDNKIAEDPALTGKAMLKAYEAILTQTLEPVLAQPAGMDPMQAAIFKQLLARSDQTGAADKLRDEGITEKAIIRLAQRIASETADVGKAWLELQNAMDIAVRVQSEGATGSNHNSFVDEVLHRVAELSREGEYADASDAIDEALKQAEAEQVRLLDLGIEIALLDRNSEKAASLLLRKADIEAGGVADTEALAQLQLLHNAESEDGSRQQAKLAVSIGRLLLTRTGHSSDRIPFQFRLANALVNLGDTAGRQAALDEAIAQYREIIDATTRSDSPEYWGRFQNNIGVALRISGERNKDGTQLRGAIASFRESLKERNRHVDPAGWSETADNLGVALQRLAELEGRQDTLLEAIETFKLTIEEHDLAKRPAPWANAYINLGSAVFQFASKDGSIDGLNEAVSYYKTITERLNPDIAPHQWATAHMNLGVVLRNIAEKTKDLSRLDEAIATYEAIEAEFSRDRKPISWADTQVGLGSVLVRYGEWQADREKVQRGIICFQNASVAYANNHIQSNWVVELM